MSQSFGPIPSQGSLRHADSFYADTAPPHHVLHPVHGARRFFHLDLRRSVQLHRRLTFGFMLAGLVLAIAYLCMFWSSYAAQSVVAIRPSPAVLEGVAPMRWPYSYDPAAYESYLQQQMLLMTRPDVLTAAVQKLGAGVWQRRGESEQNAAERLRNAIEVARAGSSYQISITAHAFNPATAAALANAVAASYIEAISRDQEAGNTERLAMLRGERERLQKELENDRAEQSALNSQLGVAAVGSPVPEHYNEDIARIHEELVKARTEHDEAAARLTSMDGRNGRSSVEVAAEAGRMVAADPAFTALKNGLLQRRAKLVGQMAALTPAQVQYKHDASELAKVDASLNAAAKDAHAKAIAGIQDQLRTDLESTAATEARLNEQLAKMTRVAASAAPKLQRSGDLAGDIARLQNRYAVVDEQLQNEMLEVNTPAMAQLAAAAVAPLHPANSGVIRNAAVLFLAFVLFGLAAAVIAHKSDPRIYTAADVERVLGFAPIAQLPNFAEVTEEAAEEHLLRLATVIDYACEEGSLRRCVFTGASPGAGTTTLAHRVKEALETLGRRAVVVDATEPAPAEPSIESRIDEILAEGFGTEKSPETSAAGQGGVDSGLLRESLVLIDAAPITVSAETEYLARLADCAIVVVESGVTTRAQLRWVATVLQRVNLNRMGFVLNSVKLGTADPTFRHAVQEVEQHRRVQGRSTAWQTIRSRYFMADSFKAATELENTGRHGTKGERVAGDATGEMTHGDPHMRLPEPQQPAATPQTETENNWDPANIPPWLSDALEKIEEAHAGGKKIVVVGHDAESPAEAGEQAAGEADGKAAGEMAAEPTTAEPTTAEPDVSREREEKEPSDSQNSTGENGFHAHGADGMLMPVEWVIGNPQRPGVAESGQGPDTGTSEPGSSAGSRLSRLRGLVPPNGLRDLDRGRYNVEQGGNGHDPGITPGKSTNGNGNGSKLDGLRGLARVENLRELRQAQHRMPLGRDALADGETAANAYHAAQTGGSSELARNGFAQPLPDSSLTGPGGVREPSEEPPRPAAEFISPQLFAAKRRIRHLPLDDVQILPSRRGQYRKKD